MKIFFINNFSLKEQIGGSEIQCWLLAKYLAKMGQQTAYVALQGLSDKKEEDGEGFKVYYCAKKNDSKIKIFINFYKLLKKEKPDICYIRVFRHLFLLTKICKFLKIPVIFNTSHINDCQPGLEKVKFSWNPFTFLKSIRIVLQRRFNFSTLKRIEVITINKEHAKILKDKYRIEATPIYNSMEDNYAKNKTQKQKQVVWSNGIKAKKNPELFIDLADRFKNSDWKFIMLGSLYADNYAEKFLQAEKKNPQFKYLGPKTLEETNKILAESSIVAITCEIEGFSCSAIQGWLAECPTIALKFDPDDIIKNNKIGFHSETFEQMVKDTKYLMENEKIRVDMGKRAREYALENHNINKNIVKYKSFFKKK